MFEVINKKVQYVEDLVNDWNTQFKLLTTVAQYKHEAAYLTFASEFRSKFNYFMRTIEISHYLVPLEKKLRNRFIPAKTGYATILNENFLLYLLLLVEFQFLFL